MQILKNSTGSRKAAGFLFTLDYLICPVIIKVGNSYFFVEVMKMTGTTFVNDARVMAKGQVTIPKNVRAALGVSTGDRVTFIVDGNNVRVINSAAYALMRFQEQMQGEAEKAGITSEEQIDEWITQSRREANLNESHD